MFPCWNWKQSMDAGQSHEMTTRERKRRSMGSFVLPGLNEAALCSHELVVDDAQTL
jgi:hypothetical protein